MNKDTIHTSEEWGQMKLLAELILRVADKEEWGNTDAARLLAELALKAYNTSVQEWHPSIRGKNDN